MRIRLTLYASPYFDEPLEHLIADQLQIQIQKKALYTLYGTFGIFNTTIDQRTSPVNISPSQLDSVQCFDKTFYHVENQPPFLNFTSSIFYTSSDGIVLFNDINGKRWCFERIE
jgi:hypothetical protein